MQIRVFEKSDDDAVVQLWIECGLVVPWNNPRSDIQRKLKVQPEMFLVACIDERIIGSVMAGYDGHRGWINYLAVLPEFQGRGIAFKLMNCAEEMLRNMNCPKINLQVRTSNKTVIEFYKRIGFRVDDAVSLGKRLIPDD